MFPYVMMFLQLQCVATGRLAHKLVLIMSSHSSAWREEKCLRSVDCSNTTSVLECMV